MAYWSGKGTTEGLCHTSLETSGLTFIHSHTQRSPTLSTPSQSSTNSLLITTHPTPEPATVWYRWNLAELTFTQQMVRFKSQTVIFTHTTLQTAPPDDPKPISVTTSLKHSQQSGLLPFEIHRKGERSALCAYRKVRSDLFLIKWNGLVSEWIDFLLSPSNVWFHLPQKTGLP